MIYVLEILRSHLRSERNARGDANRMLREAVLSEDEKFLYSKVVTTATEHINDLEIAIDRIRKGRFNKRKSIKTRI